MRAEGLDHTFVVGDEALGRGPQQVHHQAGDHDGITDDVIDRQVAEQEIHGLMESGVHADEDNNTCIGQQDDYVRKEEEEEDRVDGDLRHFQPLQL